VTTIADIRARHARERAQTKAREQAVHIFEYAVAQIEALGFDVVSGVEDSGYLSLAFAPHQKIDPPQTAAPEGEAVDDHTGQYEGRVDLPDDPPPAADPPLDDPNAPRAVLTVPGVVERRCTIVDDDTGEVTARGGGAPSTHAERAEANGLSPYLVVLASICDVQDRATRAALSRLARYCADGFDDLSEVPCKDRSTS